MKPKALDWRIRSLAQFAVVLAVSVAVTACTRQDRATVQTANTCLGGDNFVVTDSTLGDIGLGVRPESLPEGCVIVSDSVRWNREHTDRARVVEVRTGTTLVEATVSGQGTITQLETEDAQVRLPIGVGIGTSVKDALAAGFTDGDAYEGSLRLTRPSSCSPVLWVHGVALETGDVLDSTQLRESYADARVVRIGMRRCMP